MFGGGRDAEPLEGEFGVLIHAFAGEGHARIVILGAGVALLGIADELRECRRPAELSAACCCHEQGGECGAGDDPTVVHRK